MPGGEGDAVEVEVDPSANGEGALIEKGEDDEEREKGDEETDKGDEEDTEKGEGVLSENGEELTKNGDCEDAVEAGGAVVGNEMLSLWR